MKKAFIIHCWSGNPSGSMYQWIKKKLEEKGYEVEIPEMPDTDNPSITLWVDQLEKVLKDIDDETILIGHSIGCQAIMRYLEKLPEKVKFGKVIFIAPWVHLNMKVIRAEGREAEDIAKPWLEIPIDFSKVKTHSDKFICFFSDNDKYMTLSGLSEFELLLDAEIVLLNHRGHFDRESNVKDLPEIVDYF